MTELPDVAKPLSVRTPAPRPPRPPVVVILATDRSIDFDD